MAPYRSEILRHKMYEAIYSVAWDHVVHMCQDMINNLLHLMLAWSTCRFDNGLLQITQK